MAQTGLGKGLAVRHDFGADINRLYQNANLQSQIDVEKRRKAQMYGEMLKGTHVRGEYNTGRLQKEYDRINTEFADFVTENPGWETDPGLFAKAASISDQYLNNDIVREDEQVAQNFQALQQQAQTGRMDLDDINKQMDAYSNYIENGGDPYVFINPKKLEYNDILKDGVDQLVYTQKEVRFPTSSGIMGSRTEQRLKDDSLETVSRTHFNNPQYAREIIRDWKLSGGTDIAETPQLFHENNLRAQAQESESKMTYDQLGLARERSRLSNDGIPTPSAARGTVHEPWQAFRGEYLSTPPGEERQKVEQAFNERQKKQPDQKLLAFSKYEEEGGEASLNPSDRFLFQDGTPMNYTLNQTKALSGGSKYSKNGALYIETGVMVSVPTTNTALSDSLLTKGFEIVSEKASGFDPNTMLTGEEGKTNKYKGIFYSPAIMDENHTYIYDESYYGSVPERRGAHMDAKGTLTETALANSKLIETLNSKVPGFGMGSIQGNFIISQDKKTRYNPQTDIVEPNE